MQLKVQYFVVLFLMLWHRSYSAPFLANTLVLYRNPAAGGAGYLQEVYTNGTEVQKIPLPGSSAQLNQAPLHLDATGGAFSFIYTKFINPSGYRICSSFDATGTEVSTSKYVGDTKGARACHVDGSNVWIQIDTVGVAYMTTGASALTTNNIFSGCCSGATGRDMQIIGNRIYAGFDTGIKSGSPIETTGTMTPSTIYNDNNLRCFYIYKQKFYAVDYSNLKKFSLDANGAPVASPDYKFTGTIPDNAGSCLLTVVESGSDIHVYMVTTVPFTWSLYRFIDDGASISAPEMIIDHSSSPIFGITAPPSACNDGVKNVDETDVDCGGIRCKACANDNGCSVDADCTSKFCNTDSGKCAAPSCSDAFKNQDETDVDCGGTCDGCAVGANCLTDGDCTSGFCSSDKVCVTPTCSDNVKNRDESDIDCGGSFCDPCNVGQTCSGNADCMTNTCDGTKCIATCSDSVQDQDETDVDCGGNICDACADNKACKLDSDCTSGYCNPDKKCSTPSCNDGWKNQDETDVNCGGEMCLPCGDTKSCLLDRDCAGTFCIPASKTCASPSCLDTYQNGDETDVDCGGATCSGCEVGQSCLDPIDCISDTCVEGVCVNAPISPPVAVPVSDVSPQSNSPQTSSPSQQQPVAATPGKSKPVSSANTVGLSIALLSVMAMLV